MNRLIVLPLPAASRPSNRTTSLPPVSFSQSWALSSSICSSRFVSSYSPRVMRGVVRVALAPGLDREPVGPMSTGSSTSSHVSSTLDAAGHELLGAQLLERDR